MCTRFAIDQNNASLVFVYSITRLSQSGFIPSIYLHFNRMHTHISFTFDLTIATDWPIHVVRSQSMQCNAENR